MQRFSRVTPPTVHSMVLTLERRGFIRRIPRQGHSISLLLPPEALPQLLMVHHWDLMLVESGLAIWLWYAKSPALGYKLAADYCQHFDSRYGNGLNGPSATKIKEIVCFIDTVEPLEDGSE